MTQGRKKKFKGQTIVEYVGILAVLGYWMMLTIPYLATEVINVTNEITTAVEMSAGGQVYNPGSDSGGDSSSNNGNNGNGAGPGSNRSGGGDGTNPGGGGNDEGSNNPGQGGGNSNSGGGGNDSGSNNPGKGKGKNK